MVEGEVSDEDLGRVPRMAPDCDPTSLRLTPAEGFLLSRIDGQTTWRMLREIGGLPVGEVDCFLEDLLAQGFIKIDGRLPRVERRKEAPKAAKASPVGANSGIDESLLDPALDLDVEIQRKILVFEAGLDRNYFQILGVGTSAGERDVKRAYFELSKEFHPDRYFRREIGEYGPRLYRVFKKILEAYELLADPASRAELRKSAEEAQEWERKIEQEAGAREPETPGQSPAGSSAAAARPTPLERLRQRMPFRVPEGLRRERSEKGDELFDAARIAEQSGDLAGAAANLRLAIAFDSANAEYKRRFREVQARLATARIEAILKEQPAAIEAGTRRELAGLCDEALLYNENDVETIHLVARSWLVLSEFEKAMKYAEKALAERPDSVACVRTVAEIHLARGEKGHAIKKLERALELDSGDLEARKLFERLKKAPRRRSANGGVQ